MLQSLITSFEDEGISDSLKESIAQSVRDNQYVAGYRASLLYVMNEIAECVIISESLPLKHQAILFQMCIDAAIPIYASTDEITDSFPSEVDVLTVISDKS